MTSGSVPNVLSSRTRTDSPPAVTRAIMRTVAFVIRVVPRPCCDVAHAVTQRVPSVSCAEPPEAAPNPTTAAITAKNATILLTLVVLIMAILVLVALIASVGPILPRSARYCLGGPDITSVGPILPRLA